MQASEARNDYGQPVEEFEIQLIEAEPDDDELAKAMSLNQANLDVFLELAEQWEFHQKVRYAIAVHEGITFDPVEDDIDLLDVEIYSEETLRHLAIRFVDDGLYGEIPEALAHYIDYDAIARDLGMDYTEADVVGEHLIYACR